jgi:hypothetical protein
MTSAIRTVGVFGAAGTMAAGVAIVAEMREEAS